MGDNGLKDSVWQYSMTIYDYNSTIMIDTLPVTTSTIEIGSIELEDTA